MNMNGNGIDHLTRELLKPTLREPSPGLSSRIMERITQQAFVQKKEPVRVHVKSMKTTPVIIIGVIVYLLVMAFIIYFLQTPPDESGVINILAGIKEKLPYILTIVVIIGAFPFFSALDKALSF